MRKPVIIGNWKLNGSKKMVVQLLNDLNTRLKGTIDVDVAVAPPTLYIDLARRTLDKIGSAVVLGAQDSGVNTKGAFTGEISPGMLKDFGVTYVIIGHSERRSYHLESDEFIAEKFIFLKESGLIPVLCIGESEAQNRSGETVAICTRQIDSVIKNHGPEILNGAVIAYEPIWAIGTGKAATACYVQNIHAAIRAHIAKHNPTVAKEIIIQYGGSVNSENAKAYFMQPDIDGALVGNSALDSRIFAEIIQKASLS
ncbi:triosephosphate isomerase [Candidatus Photodesmus blepharus]|uniref:Triosephosphate isomerase n=1 Tax=Candidatus Photodesmus blepharonis TaxID=1179155 RepID=A0A084CNJ0_9GAMM|nr:triose-phosphate isomerase [Candidatus Photodesmus blepharus]KEY91369.1 triosephosphate isomerase [Candidatus Photodesmus blepharus]